mgnify:FL=1
MKSADRIGRRTTIGPPEGNGLFISVQEPGQEGREPSQKFPAGRGEGQHANDTDYGKDRVSREADARTFCFSHVRGTLCVQLLQVLCPLPLERQLGPPMIIFFMGLELLHFRHSCHRIPACIVRIIIMHIVAARFKTELNRPGVSSEWVKDVRE